jgi:uncharacterized protein (TIGR01244 family)
MRATWKRSTLTVALLTLAGARLGSAGDGAPTIRAYQRLSDEVRTGAQPTAEELAWLKADGVTTVINLRLPAEHDAAAETAKASELELRYFNIPVETANPKDEQADEFRKLLADPHNRPVFIYCASANRVGALWMIHRVLDDGWTIADAEAEAVRVGIKSPNLREFALDYIRRHEKAEE